jgi:multiple antibiotic resistance protein
MLIALHAFLLGFPALFSIVDPISGALIFRAATAQWPRDTHPRLARLVAFNSFVVMMGALWTGSYVLAFFGISIAALRVAGGLVLALSGWRLLDAPEMHEERKQQEAATCDGMEDIAWFPLTIPITTGPGTIAVAVALGAGHPHLHGGLGSFFVGMSAAAVVTTGAIWLAYSNADRLTGFMGPTGTRTITRLSAFLLLCIGVQILLTGINEFPKQLLTAGT